jgi:para-nitrobenzyl esterase
MHVEIEIDSGRLRGAQHADHQAFLGIPYAAPPLGSLRFAAPRPIPGWRGTRDALAFGAAALQPQRPPVEVAGPLSEDCLYLNVFTPAADGRKRPVLVWIHGGGFIVGASSQPTYYGGPLAARGDVVVVTINYRMGAFGYLYLGGHGGERWGAESNLGQLDQIAALRWVAHNIAAFGGDPASVTIFGESAGSVAVCALLTMPAARGLFVRAIGQSGTANRIGNTDTGASTCHALLGALGLARSDAEQLRSLPADLILDAQNRIAPTAGVFGPIVDGRVIPERPLTSVRAGEAKHIPLLIGTNRDEAKFFLGRERAPIDAATLERRVQALLPRTAAGRVQTVIDTYRASRVEHALPSSNVDILDAVSTASTFGVPTARLAQAQANHQPDTYVYLFDWESPARHGAFGACHALELGFVFGTIDAAENVAFTGSGPAAETLSGQMMDAWLAFAKTGNPSCDAIGTWPRYDERERNTMIFGKHTRAERAPFEKERALWDGLL